MDNLGYGRVATVAAALGFGIAVLAGGAARAGDADVVAVRVTRHAGDLYDFAVTVKSRDTGWERYADRLEAVGPNGTVLGTRVLDHPHDDEQPFTREMTGVKVPGRGKVVIRVRFKPTGYDGTTRTLNLPEDAS